MSRPSILVKQGNDGWEEFLNDKYKSPQPDRIIEIYDDEILVFTYDVDKGDYNRERFVMERIK